MEVSNSLGESFSSKFSKNDIVSWKSLNVDLNLGIIYEIYTVEMGGRQVKKAKIASFKDSRHYEILLLELKLVTKGTV